MQLRQAAALHHARYRGGFHSAASLAAAQAGMKFAVAHNIPALSGTSKIINKIYQSLDIARKSDVFLFYSH
jgi:hypothetical protein